MTVEGEVSKLSTEESSKYYFSRPRLNQLLAHASKQDQEIDSLKEVTDRIEEIDSKYKEKKLPLPEHWGGSLVKPHKIEFWQGGSGRVNIRYCYVLDQDKWVIKQLLLKN